MDRSAATQAMPMTASDLGPLIENGWVADGGAITKTFTFAIGQVLFYAANFLTGNFFFAYCLTVLMMTFANFGLQKHYIFK